MEAISKHKSSKLELDPRFECSICLDHLKDPILTSCGHKFCSSCIDSWINEKQKNYCPIDEVVLSKEDLFVDNYTRREIAEINLPCPYSQCSRKLNIPEYETHVNECKWKSSPVSDVTDSTYKTDVSPYKARNNKHLTVTVFPQDQIMQAHPHETYVCKFNPVGCREVFKSKPLLEQHYNLKTSFHLELLFAQWSANESAGSETGTSNAGTAMSQPGQEKQALSVQNGDVKDDCSTIAPFERNKKEIEAYLMKNKETESKLWEPMKNKPPVCGGATCEDNGNLLKLLYERIVLLEQSKLELEIKVNTLEASLKQTCEIEDNVLLKLCNGVYYWRLDTIHEKLKEMTQTNRYFYSPCFYSSAYGYRFCTRLNISWEDPQFLSLFIHLVQGEHDDMLPWPFKGKIIFTAVNSSPDGCVRDEILSDTNLDSFKRPLNFFLNKKAFGFNKFIRISDVLDRGNMFLMEDDTLVIKTQVIEGLD